MAAAAAVEGHANFLQARACRGPKGLRATRRLPAAPKRRVAAPPRAVAAGAQPATAAPRAAAPGAVNGKDPAAPMLLLGAFAAAAAEQFVPFVQGVTYAFAAAFQASTSKLAATAPYGQMLAATAVDGAGRQLQAATGRALATTTAQALDTARQQGFRWDLWSVLLAPVAPLLAPRGGAPAGPATIGNYDPLRTAIKDAAAAQDEGGGAARRRSKYDPLAAAAQEWVPPTSVNSKYDPAVSLAQDWGGAQPRSKYDPAMSLAQLLVPPTSRSKLDPAASLAAFAQDLAPKQRSKYDPVVSLSAWAATPSKRRVQKRSAAAQEAAAGAGALAASATADVASSSADSSSSAAAEPVAGGLELPVPKQRSKYDPMSGLRAWIHSPPKKRGAAAEASKSAAAARAVPVVAPPAAPAAPAGGGVSINSSFALDYLASVSGSAGAADPKPTPSTPASSPASPATKPAAAVATPATKPAAAVAAPATAPTTAAAAGATSGEGGKFEKVLHMLSLAVVAPGVKTNPRYNSVRTLLSAAPAAGEARLNFARSLVEGMEAADDDNSVFGLACELLAMAFDEDARVPPAARARMPSRVPAASSSSSSSKYEKVLATLAAAAAAPEVQGNPRYNPVRTLLSAAPAAGEARLNFASSLLDGMAAAKEGDTSVFGLAAELLEQAISRQQPVAATVGNPAGSDDYDTMLATLAAVASEPDVQGNPRYDAVRTLLSKAPPTGEARRNFARSLVDGMKANAGNHRSVFGLTADLMDRVLGRQQPAKAVAGTSFNSTAARGQPIWSDQWPSTA